MQNLIEYSDNYSKISANLWQYCKDIPAINDNGNIFKFIGANATDSFNFKAKITDDNGGTNNVEIMVPLDYLSNFWRTFEMGLTNCEVNLILTWSANCVKTYTNVAIQSFTLEMTEIKHFILTLSNLDDAKLLPQLKSGFQRTINWSKYLSKPELLTQNPNFNHLVEPTFQEVNRLLVLAFENDAQRTSNKTFYLPNVEIKDYNVMIHGKKKKTFSIDQ